MSDAIRAIWKNFDELIAKTDSPEAKALVEAIKLQTELINLRLAPVEHLIGTMARQVGK